MRGTVLIAVTVRFFALLGASASLYALAPSLVVALGVVAAYASGVSPCALATLGSERGGSHDAVRARSRAACWCALVAALERETTILASLYALEHQQLDSAAD